MSAARRLDPRRLDVVALAEAGGALDGEWPLAELPRLQHDALPWPDGTAPAVTWQVQGSRRAVTGGEPEIRLALQAATLLRLTCQRCLQPMEQPLAVDTRLRFVRDEALAEKLDDNDEEDVLVLTPALDLRELVEDELILALPLVPRHEHCPQPLPTSAGDDALPDADAPAQGLGALGALWRDAGGKGSGH